MLYNDLEQLFTLASRPIVYTWTSDRAVPNTTPTLKILNSIREDRMEDDYVDCCDCTKTKTVEIPQMLPDGITSLIKHVIYTLKKEQDSYKLTTVVFWENDVKTIVSNSLKDNIDTVEIDGVVTATDTAKEIGLAYSILKFLMGKDNGSGVIEGNGYVNKLDKVIRDKSYDSQLGPVKAAQEKEAAYKKHLEKVEADQARKKKRDEGRLTALRELLRQELDTMKSARTKSEPKHGKSAVKKTVKK